MNCASGAGGRSDSKTILTPCFDSEAVAIEQNAQQGFGLRRALDPAVVDQRNDDEFDAEGAAGGEHQIEIVDQRFLRLAVRLPERRLHEAVAGQACRF